MFSGLAQRLFNFLDKYSYSVVHELDEPKLLRDNLSWVFNSTFDSSVYKVDFLPYWQKNFSGSVYYGEVIKLHYEDLITQEFGVVGKGFFASRKGKGKKFLDLKSDKFYFSPDFPQYDLSRIEDFKDNLRECGFCFDVKVFRE